MSDAVTFFRMVPDAAPPMPADAGVLGTLPLPAFQHCEAVRTASTTGWYVFPAKDATLHFDGKETRIVEGGAVRTLDQEAVGREFHERRVSSVPPEFRDAEGGWLTGFDLPGIVQIWSGYCVTTAPGRSVYVKPMANYLSVSPYSIYGGVIETDVFSPCPLFANLRLHAVDQMIQISARRPLFHVLAIPNVTVPPKPTMSHVDVFPRRAACHRSTGRDTSPRRGRGWGQRPAECLGSMEPRGGGGSKPEVAQSYPSMTLLRIASRVRTHFGSRKRTVAARQMAERKRSPQRVQRVAIPRRSLRRAKAFSMRQRFL